MDPGSQAAPASAPDAAPRIPSAPATAPDSVARVRVEPQPTRLAFLVQGQLPAATAGGPSVQRGAILVTDGRTKPLEFRATEPVVVDPLQQTLYGATLDEHLAVERMGRPLLEALDHQPTCVLVMDPALLVVAETTDCPVLCLAPGKSAGEFSTAREPSFLLTSPTGVFEPVLVIGPVGQVKQMEQAMLQLGEVFTRFDLLEPFSRVETALEQVHAQSIRGRE